MNFELRATSCHGRMSRHSPIGLSVLAVQSPPRRRPRSEPSTRVGTIAPLAIAVAITAIAAACSGADAALLGTLLPRNLTPPFYINATYVSPRCDGKYRCKLTSDDTEECSCHAYCYMHDACCTDIRDSATAAAAAATAAGTLASAAALRQLDPSLYTCADAALVTAGRSVTVDNLFNIYVVNRCPSGSAFAGGALSTYCSNPLNQVWNDSVSAPVTHNVTGVTYRNVYCALCHGLDPKEVVAWSYQYTCYDPDSSLPTDAYYGISSRQGCLPGYQKPAETPLPHDCRPDVVQACADASSPLAAACSNGPTQYAYDQTRKIVYRNRECARCAAPPPAEPLSCTSWPFAHFAAMPPKATPLEDGATTSATTDLPQQPPSPTYACPAALSASMSSEERAAWLLLCPDLKLAPGRRRCVKNQRRK